MYVLCCFPGEPYRTRRSRPAVTGEWVPGRRRDHASDTTPARHRRPRNHPAFFCSTKPASAACAPVPQLAGRPHPNPAKAANGKRLRALAIDEPATAVAGRIFAEFLAAAGMFAIAEGLTCDGVPCPSAHDPVRNSHGCGIGWSKGAFRAILANPRYTGRQVWNKQRKDEVLLDINDVAPGHVTKDAVERFRPVDLVRHFLAPADGGSQVRRLETVAERIGERGNPVPAQLHVVGKALRTMCISLPGRPRAKQHRLGRRVHDDH